MGADGSPLWLMWECVLGVIGHWYSALHRLIGWKALIYLRWSLHFLFIPFLFPNSSQISELSSLEGLAYLFFPSCCFFLCSVDPHSQGDGWWFSGLLANPCDLLCHLSERLLALSYGWLWALTWHSYREMYKWEVEGSNILINQILQFPEHYRPCSNRRREDNHRKIIQCQETKESTSF